MSAYSFEAFFAKATQGRRPFDYQRRLATAPELPHLLQVPTGAGKTAAATLAWLWRRRFAAPAIRCVTPRRLVYCLPMRILVEQTERVIRSYLQALGLEQLPVYRLMGGDADDAWMLAPEADAILIGTQDLLLSRALNRGFGLNRFRWPQGFGLLHTDAFWVFDEVQLFGAGLPTTAQLAAFRRRLGTHAPTESLWMSATLQADWLGTVDHAVPSPESVLRLSGADQADPELRLRLEASKPTRRLDLAHAAGDKAYARDLAGAVLARHRSGTLTLVMLNTVERARQVHAALAGAQAETVLLHSRFRPPDRQRLIGEIAQPIPAAGRIIVSTQVVEAGVDLSAATLVTELAPWAAIVQRLGRCNRYGESANAGVWWIDLPDKHVAPYLAEELAHSRALLTGCDGESLAPARLPEVSLPQPAAEVLRLRDLLDLFDTMPDLTGSDIDISRFVREGSDHDLQLFWRLVPPGAGPAPDMAGPVRDELCSAPVGAVRGFLKRAGVRAWAFDHLADRWVTVQGPDLRPGQTLLIAAEAGGYAPETGWDPTLTAPVAVIDPPATAKAKAEAMGDDTGAMQGSWQVLADHTEQVNATLEEILIELPLAQDDLAALRLAARWHDAGKAHAVFQATLLGDPPAQDPTQTWAKAPRNGRRHQRPHFRHELASALALLQAEPEAFLAAYLVGAHHGRVRIALRSVDGELRPGSDRRFALGIWDGDQLPATALGAGVQMPATTLDLSPMELGLGPTGEPSWTEQALRLRDRLGPFRLAYLEAVLRAADGRGSARRPEGEVDA